MNLSEEKKQNKNEQSHICYEKLPPYKEICVSECQTSKDSLAVTLHRRKKKRFLKTTAPRWMRSSSVSGTKQFPIKIR